MIRLQLRQTKRRNNIMRIMNLFQKLPVLLLLFSMLTASTLAAGNGPTIPAGLATEDVSAIGPEQEQQQRHQSMSKPQSEMKLCPRMFRHIFDGYVPKGNRDAGNYTEFTNAMNLQSCVDECCAQGDNCNTAFMFNRTCYHVKCLSNALCMPVEKKKLSTTLKMVLVNPVGEEGRTWRDILEASQDTRIFEPELDRVEGNIIDKLKTMYNLQRNREELSEDIYKLPLGNPLEYDLGKYPETYMNDPYGDDPIMAASKFYPDEKGCSIGIDGSCPEHEVCVRLPQSYGLSEGICDCIDHYKRNSNQRCERVDIPQTLTAQKLIMNNIHSEAGEIDEENPEPALSNKLTVSVISKDVRLPNNEAILTAYVIPDEVSNQDKYTYSWSLISQPSKGDSNATITDQTKSQAKLSKLTEGLYRFKVTVTGRKGYGEAYPNITVLPELKINKPPDVVITPTEQTVKLPNHKAILDGSASKDDDKIVSWQWELVQGPLGYQPELPADSTLQLNDLTIPGKYTFKLTVIDSEKLANSTTATIEVLKEIDYPPEANAGQNVIVYLPNNNVTLNGSLSKDDHGIVAWEWTKASTDQSKAVDMQNTRTPYLQLSNLEEGVYAFELKVTDSKNQSSTSIVHVFVKMPTNMPPVANAGSNYTVTLPQNWATLNGSDSKDDLKIVSWNWLQISGPNAASILNANTSIANATSLTIGDYIFELTVADEVSNNATSRVKITVIQERNTAPVAIAGGDQSVTLPTNAIVLNGTRSYDDLGIANYSWSREPGSLAIGTIVDESDRKPVLILTNIVPGRYVFKLTVSDGQGLSGSDTVSVIVHPDPLVMSLVELTLTMEATVLTQSELDSLQQKLVLLIGDNTARLHIRDLKIEHKTSQVVIVFYVERNDKDQPTIIPAVEVDKILKEKFWRDYTILGTTVAGIRTAICQNDCSGHGVCNAETRDCMCQSFWMPDIFFFWGVAEANCDWSILYVIIGVFIVFLILSGICWGITCLCRRSVKPRTRNKTQKYSLLGTQDDELPTFNRAETALSESETDSDVLFENRSKQNGIRSLGLPNGDARNGHVKYKTRLGRRIKT